MKLTIIILLSTFIIVGIYVGGYSWLYTQKVKEAQRETSILTPPRLVQLLHSVIIGSFSVASLSLLYLLYELVTL